MKIWGPASVPECDGMGTGASVFSGQCKLCIITGLRDVDFYSMSYFGCLGHRSAHDRSRLFKVKIARELVNTV